ncbi:PepSY-associated TM helix domain-containing protein [Methylomonas methanica]|uniref:PepSY-associated TM helix domain-containing protein n=1 Tax=Methylomonas methanica TaxID=421 RepID=UPI001E5E5699|nr:PepSY-associated TM helix domain-containing protein [Methylomonas methanica]
MTRQLWVLLHRYVGLVLTAFLIVVGLTGSLLAFLPELNHIFTPQLFPPVQSGTPLKAAVLAERAQALVPNALINGVNLGTPGTAIINVIPGIDPSSGKLDSLVFNQLFLNPVTGNELGHRMVGGLPDGLDNLMPFIYELHDALALGETGAWILGIVAVIWTIDCFVSLYLTLPIRRRKALLPAAFLPFARGRSKPWWQRWRPAWVVRWKASSYKLNFDLHRAGGLWLWAALLVFAWSSVGFNMKSVYVPVTQWLFDYPNPQSIWGMPTLDKPLQHPAIGWQKAQEIAERLLTEQAQLHGFTVEQPVALYLNRALGFYVYWVRSSLDIQDKGGGTVIAIDANTGEFKGLHLPTGQYSGKTVSQWLFMLHMANVFGLPYRIFVCVLGLAIVMLSVTGIIIWLRKRNVRRILQPLG